MIKLFTCILIIGIITSCKFSQHTREMWDDVPRIQNDYRYTTNTIRCKMIDGKRIAIWLEDNNYGKNNCDKTMPEYIRKSCAIYEFEKDMSKIDEKIKSVEIVDRVVVDPHSDYVQFHWDTFKITFDGDYKNNGHLVDGRLISPDKDTKIFTSENIKYTRIMKVSTKNYRDPTVVGYTLVTPVTVTMDIAESALVVGTAPIWFPLLIWMFHDFNPGR